MKKIAAIHFTVPELMAHNAEEAIRQTLESLEKLRGERADCFMRGNELDAQITEKEAYLKKLSGLYTIEYEKPEVKEMPKGECFMVVESNGTVHI